MEDNSLTLKLISLLVIVSLVAVLVAVYHFIIVCWIIRRRNPIPPHHVHQQSRNQDNDYSLEIPVVLLIPAHKHQKGLRLDAKEGEGDDTDAICSICLGEFQENEELRTLPVCSHSFHVPCIDMWLFSHSTCPVCRTDAVPLSQTLFRFLSSNSDVDVRRVASNNV